MFPAQLTGWGGGSARIFEEFQRSNILGGRSRGERMRGEGGEGVRLRDDEGREVREGVCVQERESADM